MIQQNLVTNLIEEQFITNPNKIAIIHNEKKITYKTLLSLYHKYSHALCLRGLEQGDLIGIECTRSIDTIALILACARLGIIFVPIDKDYSPHRREHIYLDCKPKVIIADEANEDEDKIFTLMRLYELAGNSDREHIQRDIPSDQPLCILYTSGSTGIPKGVVRSHRAVFSQISFLLEDKDSNREETVAQISSLSFVPSLIQIFGSLGIGATISIIDEIYKRDADTLISKCNKDKITKISLVPSLFAVLLDTIKHKKKELSTVKKISCTGEYLNDELIQKHFEVHPHIKLFNTYGSTEVGGIGWQEYTKSSAAVRRFSLYSHIQVSIVGDDLKTCGVNIRGQIAISSPSVGYYYSKKGKCNVEEKEKYFLTGDFGYLDKEGKLVLLGRNNDQVKINSQRINLEEINIKLEKYPGIEKSIVLKKDNHGEKLVFYFSSKHYVKKNDIKTFAKRELPSEFVPLYYVNVKAWPLLPNGKIDKLSLPEPTSKDLCIVPTNILLDSDIEAKIHQLWANILGLEKTLFSIENNFFDLGGTSLLLMKLASELSKAFPEAEIQTTDLFKYPTVKSMAAYCHSREKDIGINQEEDNSHKEKKPMSSKDIAIIGAACRFPGATNMEEYWKNLENGIESIRILNAEEVKERQSYSQFLNPSDKVIPAVSEIRDIDKFDNNFFEITAAEAKLLDPQQRVLLEVVWHALETAGYTDENCRLKKGIFVGASDSKYFTNNILLNKILHTKQDHSFAHLLNSTQFLATRIAYKINATGPAITVNTACSTSLVAVGMACESIRAGQCDIAIAGGVSLVLPDEELSIYQPGGILSSDGSCRPFDMRAEGTLLGSGVGIVILKSLDKAICDNDNILAVIKGVGVNNDGNCKIGFTAPSEQGQVNCISQALAEANVFPSSVGYIEAHGTGTKLGDPIEFSALKKAMSFSSDTGNMCALGSVKGNIGHANVAAGVAGLIKAVLCLQHRKLVPSINFEKPNPQIDLNSSHFYVNTQVKPWQRVHDQPLRAAVTSLGMGGTNAHIILEEAPQHTSYSSYKDFHILTFSAHSENALQSLMKNMLAFMEKQVSQDNPKYSIGNFAYSLWKGQKKFPYRATLVCQTYEEGISLLKDKIISLKQSGITNPKVGLVLSGNINFSNIMSLYSCEKNYKAIFDKCLDVIEKSEYNWKSYINFTRGADSLILKARVHAQKTSFFPLSYFIIKYSLAKYLVYLGMESSFFVGNAEDTFIAACLVGSISLEEAIEKIIREENSIAPDSFIHLGENHLFSNEEVFTSLSKTLFLDICSFNLSLNLSHILERDLSQNAFLLNFYQLLAQLWNLGVNIKLENIIPFGNRLSLPPYPFLKISHWIPRSQNLEKTKIRSEETENQEEFDSQEIEERVLQIWKEVFEEDDLTLESNFYDLGGHSLLALQLASQINTALGINFLTSDILENSSIRKLVTFIKDHEPKKSLLITESEILDEETAFSLSYGQQKMWLLDKIYPEEGICAVPVAIKIKGYVDTSLLEKSIMLVVEKHPILRTKFFNEGTSLKQKIEGSLPFSVLEKTLHDDSNLDRMLKKYIAIPFDLENPPLFRIVSIKLKKNRTLLLFVFHHIVIDSWSLGVFWKDLQLAYSNLGKKDSAVLDQSSFTYKDFIVDQQKGIENGNFERQLSYWKEELKGISQVSLPKKINLKDSVETHKVKCFTWEIKDKKLLSLIDEICAKSQCTRFVFFYSIFVLLMFYYSGNEDVSVFTAFANRKDKKEQSVMGLFSTPHILRLNIEAIGTLRDLLVLAKGKILKSLDNQDVPFELIKEKHFLNENIESLVNVLFLFHENHLTDGSFLGNEIEKTLEIFPPGIQQELCLEIKNKENFLNFNFIYKAELFKPVIIKQLADNYIELVRILVSSSEKFIKDISLSSKIRRKENNKLQKSSADRDASFLEKSLCDLFEAKAHEYPDKAALVNDIGEELSFSELRRQVNSLAFYLKSQGIQPGDTVGISLPPSFSLISGILAVLKIGGIYLPLDPLYPESRLAYYIDHSKTKWVLTNKKIQQDLFSQLSTEVVCLVLENHSLGADEIVQNINSEVATILYTSGSTGDPKGVVIRQKSIINRCYWFRDFYGWSCNDVGCLSTTINFVDSLAEMFECVLFGSKLLIVDREKISNVKSFSKLIKKHKVSKLVLVPSFLKVILSSRINRAYLNTLRFLTCSGEILPVAVAKTFVQTYPNVRLLNFYGSTEVMADVASFEVSSRDANTLSSIPIGKPILNADIYILNKYKALLPIGAVGDIFVGGICLAAGYLHNEKKTKESFVEISANNTKHLVYDTKDRGYLLPDGNIIYSGRIDSIVKLHGNTIDLSEVESCIKSSKLVNEVAVLIRDDEESKILVAYIIPAYSNGSEHLIKGHLFAYLRGKLPRYMVPGLITLLDKFPLTANGKLDKIALLNSGVLQNDRGKPLLTNIQLDILSIWKKLLKISATHAYDSFFEVGGSSLLAIQLILEIENVFSVTLELSDIIKNPTLEGIETLIIKERQEKAFNLSSSKNLKLTPSLVAFHPITGLGVDYVRLEHYLSPHRLSIMTYPFGKNFTFNSIEDMARYYSSKVETQKTTPLYLVGYSMGGILALEAARYLSKKGYSIERVIMIDTYYPHRELAKKKNIATEAMKLRERLSFSKVSEGDINSLMPIITDHMQLLSRYEPKSYEGPVNFLKSSAYHLPMLDLWKKNLKNLAVYDLPGDHYSIFEEQNIQKIANFILNSLLSFNKIKHERKENDSIVYYNNKK